MNLLLLDRISESYSIGPQDRRFESLSRLAGPEVCVGVVDGLRGIGLLEKGDNDEFRISEIDWEKDRPHPPNPVEVCIGLPRPSEVRRILFLVGLWGIQSIRFLVLEKIPKGYADAKVLETSSVQEALREGVEQGFHTRLPRYDGLVSLDDVLEKSGERLVALDPYWGEKLLGPADFQPSSLLSLLFGGERGYSESEQEKIRKSGVVSRHLGPLIYRTESALSTALSLVHGNSDFMQSAADAQISV